MSDARPSRPEPPTWRVLAGYLLSYLVLDWLSYIHPVWPLAITPWNPPPALSLALLLHFGARVWPALFAAAFLAEALVRDIPLAPAYAAVSSLWLTGGYVLAAWLLERRLGFDNRFLSLRDAFVFLAAIPPLTLAIGMGYVAVYVFAGLIPPERFLYSSIHFWIGDMIGVVVVTPLLLVHWPHLFAPHRIRLSPELLAQAAAILLAIWLIFGLETTDEYKFFYLLFLPLSWAAIRKGVEGATVANLAIQLGLIGALLWRGHLTATVLDFQFLMLALAATGLLLGMAISERRRALAALEERETALGQALRAAAVGEMTSALAHELNQPLMAISSYARASQHLAAELPGSETLSRTLDSLVDKVTHAGDVVHRLREYYRYGGLHRENLALAQFVDNMIDPLRHRAERYGVVLNVGVDEDAGDLQADPVQLGIVLHNLVANAIESLANAPAHVREVALHISRPDRSAVRFCVEDNGPGVDPALAAELFSPLMSHKSKGMGLGLSICRSLVEGHGGHIWHEAPRAGGARFCFDLPTPEDESGSDRQHR